MNSSECSLLDIKYCRQSTQVLHLDFMFSIFVVCVFGILPSSCYCDSGHCKQSVSVHHLL